jgi:hypothetical protein
MSRENFTNIAISKEAHKKAKLLSYQCEKTIKDVLALAIENYEMYLLNETNKYSKK